MTSSINSARPLNSTPKLGSSSRTSSTRANGGAQIMWPTLGGDTRTDPSSEIPARADGTDMEWVIGVTAGLPPPPPAPPPAPPPMKVIRPCDEWFCRQLAGAVNIRNDGEPKVWGGGVVVNEIPPPAEVWGMRLCLCPRGLTRLRLKGSSVSDDFLRRNFLTRSAKRVKLSRWVPCLNKENT